MTGGRLQDPSPRLDPADATRRRRRLATAAVGLVAFATSAAYALLAAPNLLPISDANGYRLLGRHLAEGRGYIRPYDFALDGVVRPTAEFPPGFPALLAVADLVGLDGVRAQRLVLAVVAALVAVGVVVLARRFLPEPAAVAVGLVVAVHPAFFQPGAAMLAESLYALAVVAVLVVVIRFDEVPLPRRALVVGLIGGAAGLVRSEGMILALVLIAPLLVTARPRKLRAGAALALVAGLLVLPGAWALRNLSTFTEPVLVSNNLGSVLSGANCDATYRGDLVGYWFISEDCFAGFTAEALAAGDESVVAGQLRDDGLAHARTEADRLPAVAVVRVLRTFQLWEPEQQARLSTFEGRRLLTERITGWITWATLGLAAIGTVALLRDRRHLLAWFLVAPVLVVVGVAAVTYGNPRFRIGAEVALLLLAVEGIRAMLPSVRDALGRARRARSATQERDVGLDPPPGDEDERLDHDPA